MHASDVEEAGRLLKGLARSLLGDRFVDAILRKAHHTACMLLISAGEELLATYGGKYWMGALRRRNDHIDKAREVPRATALEVWVGFVDVAGDFVHLFVAAEAGAFLWRGLEIELVPAGVARMIKAGAAAD